MDTTDLTFAESLRRLTADMKIAARELTNKEARYAVDLYYQIQEYRKRAMNQTRPGDKSNGVEPNFLIDWLASNFQLLEHSVKSYLEAYAKSQTVGKWSLDQYGIGPVISAGLLAHIDMEIAKTAGHIWSFAGINPGVEWKKGQKRPWNQKLKTLCWHVGQSFNKFQNRDQCFYGKLLKERKQFEVDRNMSGELHDQAVEKLAAMKSSVGNWKSFTETIAYKWYSGQVSLDDYKFFLQRHELPEELSGDGTLKLLPPAHIQQRAERWTTKMFLSHWHAVAYYDAFKKEPPRPYVIEHMGHADVIKPPNWPFEIEIWK